MAFSTCMSKKEIAAETEGNDSILALISNARALETKLKPLHTKKRKPRKGDWLDQRIELGQTYARYVRGNPTQPTESRNKIYFRAIGDFNETEMEIINGVVEYIERFYHLEVKVLPAYHDSIVPAKSRRINKYTKKEQLHTGFILRKLMKKEVPEDAAAYIAFTKIDLYPFKKANYVFGQATLKKRVGVWSIARYGDPSESEEAFNLCLERTCKVASHELGHMFSMWHCIYYECNMNGSMNLDESDRQPPYLCPVCMSKVHSAMGTDHIDRARGLLEFWQKNGHQKWIKHYESTIEKLKE